MITTSRLAQQSAPRTDRDVEQQGEPVTPTFDVDVDVEPQRTAADAGATTRRTLLGAGLGALVATIAASLGRPQSAKATDGDPVTIGYDVTTTIPTTLQNRVNDNEVIVAKSVAVGGGGTGGGAAIHGDSESGRGVWGTTRSGNGVEGRSATHLGVYGFANSGDGVHGYSGSGDGVSGYADAAGNGKAGLRGLANTDQSYGAFAENLIAGTKGSLGGPKAGVVGQAPDALGFVGVAATAGDAATALSVTGRAQFSRSGRASVPSGRSYVVVNVPGGLSGASLAVATPMLNRAGVYVQSAVPDPNSGQIRINLNKVASSSSSTPIAWFVIN